MWKCHWRGAPTLHKPSTLPYDVTHGRDYISETTVLKFQKSINDGVYHALSCIFESTEKYVAFNFNSSAEYRKQRAVELKDEGRNGTREHCITSEISIQLHSDITSIRNQGGKKCNGCN